MKLEAVREQLKNLRLHTAANEIEAVIADQKKIVSLAWLGDLLEREIDARKEKALSTRIKQASFPEVTTLEEFDFSFNPDIDEAKVRQLATLDFLDARRIALFLGKPGTGKTHLALALGLIAARKGHRVQCTSVKRLAQRIVMSKAKGSLDLLFKKLLSAELWILDDWGVVSMTREVAEEVFDLLDRRKHTTALILTSNRDVTEWGQVFPEPVLASAAIDRLFDRAEIICFRGESYRLKGRIITQDIDVRQKEVH